jgi:hypothetical protein
MTSETKQRWLRDLRSGEFKQGHGKLYDPKTQGWCCLGVLCKTDPSGYDDSANFYPRIQLEFGLTIADIRWLSMHNDNYYFDFYTIADWIDVDISVTD